MSGADVAVCQRWIDQHEVASGTVLVESMQHFRYGENRVADDKG
jgi:hypothetical protein